MKYQINTPVTINHYIRKKNENLVIKKIFLAGPIKGNLSWRDDFVSQIRPSQNIVIFSPQRYSTPEEYKTLPFDEKKQIAWETEMLNISDIIIFCIQPSEYEVSDYARTTRFELGEWIGRIESDKYLNKQILVYIDPSFPGYTYIKGRIANLQYETRIKMFSTVHALMLRLNRQIKILNEI